MTWQDALKVVIARTKHEAFRWLCSDNNPDVLQRDGMRQQMLVLAGMSVPEPPEPSPDDLALQAYVQQHGCGGCDGYTGD